MAGTINRPSTAFEGSTFRSPRRKDKDHLNFIRSLPCIVCLSQNRSQATHIRFSCPEVDKRETGWAEKSDDLWTLPMCKKCHDKQHAGSERAFWDRKSVAPILTALALWAVTGDEERGERIIRRAKM